MWALFVVLPLLVGLQLVGFQLVGPAGALLAAPSPLGGYKSVPMNFLVIAGLIFSVRSTSTPCSWQRAVIKAGKPKAPFALSSLLLTSYLTNLWISSDIIVATSTVRSSLIMQ